MYSFNYLLVIQYDGTGFAGWQKQSKEGTIQGAISRELEKLCGHKIDLIGASRTDAGVHAIGQAANFKTNKFLKPDIIKRVLNATLSPEIIIKEVKKVSRDFHARYNARKKLYRYVILREPSPFLYNYVYPYFGKISETRIRKAAAYLKGRYNFRSFCDGKIGNKNPIRSIDRITVSHNLPPIYPGKSRDVISMDVEGRSFLCHMVRIIAGTLIEAGRGALSPEKVKKILKARDRTLAGRTLPAKGLFLMKVYY